MTQLTIMEALIQMPGVLAEALRQLQQQEYMQRANLVVAASLAGGVYLHLVVRKISPGYASLLAVAPLVVLNCFVPLLFSARTEIPSRIAFCINNLWLANFKALGLCCNRGPLVLGTQTAAQTILLYMLPLYPRQDSAVKKGRLSDHIGGPGAVAGVFLSSAVLLGLLAFALTLEWLSVIVRHYLLGLLLYSFINFMMAGPAAILVGLLNMEVVPAFDKPWLSTSLADYWSRRWNNTTSLLLRALVYDPIVEGSLLAALQQSAAAQQNPDCKPCTSATIISEPLLNTKADSTAAAVESCSAAAVRLGNTKQERSTTASSASSISAQAMRRRSAGSTATTVSSATNSKSSTVAVHCNMKQSRKVPLLLKAAGLTATFAVSGLMHELVLYLCNDTDRYRFGYWFAFFVVQAPLLITEGIFLQKLRTAGLHVPRAIGIMYNTFFVLSTAYVFWFPPLETQSDIAEHVVQCITSNVGGWVQMLQQLVRQT